MNKLFVACLIISLMTVSSVSLTSCNTIEGAGQDIEHVGDSIEDSAREAND